jgi:hypothetical protein
MRAETKGRAMKRIALVSSLLLTVTFAVTPTLAQDNTTRIRGTIVSFEGNVLTVAAAGENRSITVAEHPNIVWLVKSDLSKITPGMFVGSAATMQADGTLRAVEVHIFAESMRGTGEGSRPYDLGPQSSMTNGTVDTNAQVESVGDHVLTIKYKDGEKKIVVGKDTPVVLYEATDAKALAPGAHVYVIATRGADGTLSTVRINVGKNGVVPAM